MRRFQYVFIIFAALAALDFTARADERLLDLGGVGDSFFFPRPLVLDPGVFHDPNEFDSYDEIEEVDEFDELDQFDAYDPYAARRVFTRPIPFNNAFNNAFGASFDDDALVRAQTSIAPPVESSSTPTIGQSFVASSTSSIALPPVVGSDEPYEPIQVQTNEDSTTIQKMFKYRQNISGSYLFIPRGKKRGLGVHELEARMLFAFPCNLLKNSPQINNGVFFLTPSFVYDNFSFSKDHTCRIAMPKNVFDAGLTTSFLGKFQDLEATVEVSVGVASSFKKIHGKAVYVRGRAEVMLPIDNEKQFKALGGVAYLNRIKYKLVPIVGFVWNPNPQNELRIVYPNPRWAHYLTKVNETDWWFYISGDIGGGRWYISDPKVSIKGKTSYNVDYDDYKFGAGVMFECSTRLKGAFEVGGAFGREIRSKAGKEYAPKNSVYLKVGLFY